MFLWRERERKREREREKERERERILSSCVINRLFHVNSEGFVLYTLTVGGKTHYDSLQTFELKRKSMTGERGGDLIIKK